MKTSIAQPAPAGAANLRTRPAPRWALASLSLAMLLASLGTSIANVGLPALAQAFNATFAQVQWVVLAYLLAITSLIVSVGRLGDMIGRRRLLLAGIVLFTLASLLCAGAAALWLLVAARALQGLGAAIMMVLAMALVAEAVPQAKTGSAMGLLGTMSAVGTALGPTLGGGLLAGFGWPALFLVNVPLGLLAVLLAYRHLPSDGPRPATERGGLDGLGTLLLALTLGAYALALTLGRGHFGPLNGALLLGAAMALGLFVLVQARVRFPLIHLALFNNPVLSAGFAMSALVTTVVMATLVVGPFYLAGALALDTAQVGLVMSCGPLVAALTGAPAGRWVDRLGAYPVSMVGLIAMAVGCVSLALLAGAGGVAGYIAPLVGITAGYALFQAANNTAVMTGIGSAQRGLVSGLLNLSRNLGLITGASLMGTVFAIGAASSNLLGASPQALVAGLRTSFALATVLVAVALAIARMGAGWRR